VLRSWVLQKRTHRKEQENGTKEKEGKGTY